MFFLDQRGATLLNTSAGGRLVAKVNTWFWPCNTRLPC
jgi:hypothetical protein